MLFTSRYALQRRGPKRLLVRRTRTWDNVSVRLDAVELGPTNKEALLEGVEYKLYDHSMLRLSLEPGPNNTFFLMITRNGHPLPGSDGDPVKILWTTLVVIWSIAALQLAFSMMMLQDGRDQATTYWTLGLGAALVILGILAWHRNLAAMVLACAVSFGEVLWFVVTVGNVNAWNAWRLVFGMSLFGWLLLRGIKAVRDLKSVALPIRHPILPS